MRRYTCRHAKMKPLCRRWFERPAWLTGAQMNLQASTTLCNWRVVSVVSHTMRCCLQKWIHKEIEVVKRNSVNMPVLSDNALSVLDGLEAKTQTFNYLILQLNLSIFILNHGDRSLNTFINSSEFFHILNYCYWFVKDIITLLIEKYCVIWEEH